MSPNGGAVQKFRISGIAEFGQAASLGGATLAIFDLATAQTLFHKQGELDQIDVSAKSGVTSTALVSQIKTVLPPHTQVLTSESQAKEKANEVGTGLKFLQYFLLAFGGIALFVGAFVIANTLSITVAQRTREFATLRAMGATGSQIRRVVVIEGLVTGLFASVIGLFVGLGLAKGLDELFKAFGADLPQTGLVFATRTVIVSIVLGTLVTVLASLRPAVRATRVPPIAAVREGSILPPSRFARFGPVVALGGLRGIAASLLGAFGRSRHGPAAADARIGVLLALRRVALVALRSSSR